MIVVIAVQNLLLAHPLYAFSLFILYFCLSLRTLVLLRMARAAHFEDGLEGDFVRTFSMAFEGTGKVRVMIYFDLIAEVVVVSPDFCS